MFRFFSTQGMDQVGELPQSVQAPPMLSLCEQTAQYPGTAQQGKSLDPHPVSAT